MIGYPFFFFFEETKLSKNVQNFKKKTVLSNQVQMWKSAGLLVNSNRHAKSKSARLNLSNLKMNIQKRKENFFQKKEREFELVLWWWWEKLTTWPSGWCSWFVDKIRIVCTLFHIGRKYFVVFKQEILLFLRKKD